MKSKLTIKGAIGAAGLTLLIGTELYTAAMVAVWALSRLLGLEQMGHTILTVLVGLPSTALLIKVGIMAVESEKELLDEEPEQMSGWPEDVQSDFTSA